MAIPFCGVSRYLFAFFAGAIACDISLNTEKKNSLCLSKKVYYILVLIGLIYCATVNISTTGIYCIFKPFRKYIHYVRIVGIAGLVCMLYSNEKAKRFLSKICCGFLSNICGNLYIFHWPIILSIGCLTFIKLYNIVDYNILSLVILVVTVIFSIIVGYIYWHLVRLIRRVNKKIKYKYLTKEKKKFFIHRVHFHM